MRRRAALLTTNALISVFLVAALLVAVNYLGTEHHVRWDLTATREHSLSPQTIKILRSLSAPIEAVAFPHPDSAEGYRQFLNSYRYYSRNFQYRIVDPTRDPAVARRYKATSYGQIVLQRGSASYTVDSDTEDALTNGILHVLETTKKTVYVLQGEGEVPLDDFTRGGMGTAKQALTGKGFEVKPLVLLTAPRVPEDASAVVIPAPAKDFLPGELEALSRYYRTGGKLLVMIDPQSPPGIRAWLASQFHVRAPGGLVVDPNPVSQLYGLSPAVPIVTQYPHNDITQNFTLATAFPVSTPLEPDPKATGVTITPVVKTSDAGYVQADLKEVHRFRPGVDRKGSAILAVEVIPAPQASPAGAAPDGTRKTPPPVAAASGKGTPAPPAPAPTEAPTGSAVIFGNSAFIQNAASGFPGNQDLFLSTVAWLTQSGNLVSISPRASPFEPFLITGRVGRVLFLGGVLGLPLALIALGGSIYYRRRRL